jgi:hypothetical protein
MGAGAARHGIGPAYDTHDEVACRESAVGWGVLDASDRLVTDDEPVPARGSPAVVTANDLLVGATHTDGQAADEQVVASWSGIGDLLDQH